MRRRTRFGIAVAGAAAAAAAAIAAIAAKTNDEPADWNPEAPTLEPDVDGEAYLQHLGAAVRIDTTVYEDTDRNDPAPFLELHGLLELTYPRLHETLDRELVNDLSLLYHWHGSDPGLDPIVLMAHMDVVPVEPGTEEAWTVDPFSGIVSDGHLWGRGVLDDKGPLIAICEAVEQLLGTGFTPTRSVYLTFGHDEEIGGTEGAAPVADLLRRQGVTPWFVLDEGGGVVDGLSGLVERPIAAVMVAEKGYLDIKLTATGEGGHSSIPPASTAAGKIAAAISALEQTPVPARVKTLEPFIEPLLPFMESRPRKLLSRLSVTGPLVERFMRARPALDASIRTTTAVTMVSGGVKPNVLPQDAWAIVNFRILPGDTTDSVIAHVRSVVGDDIGIEVYGPMRSEPSPRSSTDSDAWTVLTATISETFPEAVIAPWVLTGATDSRNYGDFASDVYGFGPMTTDERYSGIHATDERLRVSDAERAVSFFVRLLRSSTG